MKRAFRETASRRRRRTCARACTRASSSHAARPAYAVHASNCAGRRDGERARVADGARDGERGGGGAAADPRELSRRASHIHVHVHVRVHPADPCPCVYRWTRPPRVTARSSRRRRARATRRRRRARRRRRRSGRRRRARTHLGCISPASRLYLTCISAVSRRRRRARTQRRAIATSSRPGATRRWRRARTRRAPRKRPAPLAHAPCPQLPVHSVRRAPLRFMSM